MSDPIPRAAMFKALGDPTRLRIFDFLRSCCGPVSVEQNGAVRRIEGPTVGEVCCHVTGGEKITSTVSFHLKELRQAGLIETERRGKTILCSVNRETVAALVEYLGEPEGATCDGCCD